MKWLVIAVAIALCLALTFSTVGCSTKDTVPPSTPTGISSTTPGNDTTPTFSWNAATDADSGIDYYLVSVDGGEWMNVGNVTTYTLNSALSDGSHTFKVEAVDKAGNEGDEGGSTFTVEVIPTNHLVLTMTHDDASPGYYNGNVVDIRFTDNIRFTLDDKFGTFSGDYSYGGGKLALDFDSYPAWTMTFTDATNFTGTEAGYADTGTYSWQ